MYPAVRPLGVCLLLAALLAAPSPASVTGVATAATAPAPTGGSRDTLVIGMNQEPDRLGRFSVMSAARVVEGALFAHIAPYTERWVRRPVLVEDFPTLANGRWQVRPDGRMRLVWRIRRGFRWHDGRPVTALDFRFTFAMVRHPATPGVSRAVLAKVEHVFVPNPDDPYTLVVQWRERYPFAGTLPFGEPVVFPRHRLEAAFLRSPARLPLDPYWRAPLGNGPYRFVEWVPGSHILLEAVPHFLLGTPRIRRLLFRFVPDATVLQTLAIAGQVDATEINGFGVEQALEVQRRGSGVVALFTPSLRWERILFNLDDPWLADRRVRWAIAHAIDREGIVRTLFQGRYPLAHTWLAPRHPASNPHVRRYAYNPARARQLLAEAGFTPGPDGVLRDPAGRRVELTIMSTAGVAVREQIEEIIQEQLRAVGIALRIDNRPASVLLGQITVRRQFPHLALYSTLFSLESTGFEGFHSSQIPSPANNWEGFNVMGWRHPENDRLLEAITTELDERRRHELLRRQQAIFAEELPALPLYFVPAIVTVPRTLRGVRPTGLFGSFLTWNAWEWAWAE